MYSDPDQASRRNKQASSGFDSSDDAASLEYEHPEYYRYNWPATPYGSQASGQDDSPYTTYTDPVSYDQPVSSKPVQRLPDPFPPASGVSDGNDGMYQQGTDEAHPVVSAPAPEKRPSGLKGKLVGIGSGIVALFAWLMKFKFLLFFLKFGVAGFSALASVFFYSLLFGWPFAIGLVTILFLHEMGHALVMKLKGIPMSGVVFIPMIGAAVMMRQMPQNAKDEAEIGIAGPLAGALVASVCLWLSYRDPSSIWGPLAYFGFFVNLFNLIPVVPFDGGRVLAAIDRRAWFIGFIILLGYQIWEWMHGNFNSFLLIFVIIAAMQFWMRSRSSQTEPPSYYNVPLSVRISLTFAYFGLAAILFMGMTLSQGLLPGVGM